MTEIKLPFGEAVRRSFSFVFNHMQAFVKISLLWGILITFLDCLEKFPSLCLSDTDNCAAGDFNLYLFLMFFAEISIGISFIRYVIERTEYKSFFTLRFGKRDLKYIWAMMKLIFAGILISMLIGMAFGIMGEILRLGTQRQISIIFSVISFFFVSMFLSRYSLIFPAIAMDNPEISFEKSYQLTRGNINAIFWGMVVVSLPIALINIMIGSFYFALGTENFVIKFIFSFILIMANLLNDAVKASFLAHIYQYFLYFYKQSEKTKEVAE